MFFVCKANFDAENRDRTCRTCLCVCVRAFKWCPSQAVIPQSRTVEITIVKLGTVTASYVRMHHVLIILTLTFIQGHTYLSHVMKMINVYFKNYSSNDHHVRCEDSPTKGLIVTTASPMTLTFIQDHKCASMFSDYFLTCNISNNIQAITSKLGMTVDLSSVDGNNICHSYAGFNDLDLDATGQKSACSSLDNSV